MCGAAAANVMSRAPGVTCSSDGVTQLQDYSNVRRRRRPASHLQHSVPDLLLLFQIQLWLESNVAILQRQTAARTSSSSHAEM